MNKKPILIVKPEFIPKMIALKVLMAGVLGAFFLAGALEMLFFIIFAILGFGTDFGTIFTFVFIVCAIGFPAILYELKRKNYNNIYFKFFDNYVEFSYFTEPMMNKRQGRLQYADIEDMMQYTNFMQNFVSLETIRIYAPNSRLYDSYKNFIGIELSDVKQSKHIGQKIQKILDRWEEANIVHEEQNLIIKKPEHHIENTKSDKVTIEKK